MSQLSLLSKHTLQGAVQYTQKTNVRNLNELDYYVLRHATCSKRMTNWFDIL
jgi:hypothetical protein